MVSGLWEGLQFGSAWPLCRLTGRGAEGPVPISSSSSCLSGVFGTSLSMLGLRGGRYEGSWFLRGRPRPRFPGSAVTPAGFGTVEDSDVYDVVDVGICEVTLGSLPTPGVVCLAEDIVLPVAGPVKLSLRNAACRLLANLIESVGTFERVKGSSSVVVTGVSTSAGKSEVWGKEMWYLISPTRGNAIRGT